MEPSLYHNTTEAFIVSKGVEFWSTETTSHTVQNSPSFQLCECIKKHITLREKRNISKSFLNEYTVLQNFPLLQPEAFSHFE